MDDIQTWFSMENCEKTFEKYSCMLCIINEVGIKKEIEKKKYFYKILHVQNRT